MSLAQQHKARTAAGVRFVTDQDQAVAAAAAAGTSYYYAFHKWALTLLCYRQCLWDCFFDLRSFTRHVARSFGWSL